MKFLVFILTILQFTLLCAEPVNNDNDKWYTHWSLGFARPTYNQELGLMVDKSKENRTPNRIVMTFDVYGFYWPLVPSKTLLGFTINVVGDLIYYSEIEKALGIGQALLGPSAMHFFSSPSKGFFLRGDFGFSKYAVDRNIYVSEKPKRYDSNIGIGTLLGGGYVFASTKYASYLLNLNTALRWADSVFLVTYSITVGGLF